MNSVITNRLQSSVSKEVINEIDKNFNDFAEPFKFFDTKDKRLTIYKQLGLYSKPKILKIAVRETYCNKNQKHLFISKSIVMVHLNMEHSLRMLLEMEGLYAAIISYMSELEKEKNVVRNFLQGDLWKDVLKKFKEDKKEIRTETILPYILRRCRIG